MNVGRGVVAAGALLVGFLFTIHIRFFHFITDDAYISFVYSRNLARGHGLVYNPGDRVEGYTNFLWTVLLGLQMKLGLPPETTSLLWGFLFGLATLFVLVLWWRQLAGRQDAQHASSGRFRNMWSLAAPAWLAGCGAYACWSSGGLETLMFAFLLTLGFWAYTNGRTQAGLWLGLAALTRPEGHLLFALVFVHALLRCRMRSDWRFLLKMGLLFAAVTVPHWIFRLQYYGYLFPNTFYIKSSGTAGTARRGLVYLGRVAADYGMWLLPLLLVRPSQIPVRRVWSLAIVVVLGFSGYVIWVGGDFMGLYRFVLPIFPLLAFAAMWSLRRLVETLASFAPWAPRQLAIGVLVLYFGAFGVASYRTSVRAHTLIGDDPPRSGIDTPAFLRKFANDRALIGKRLHGLARPGDTMTVGGAGAQVYYADLPAVDAFGLTDKYIAHQVPSTSNRPGHQKWAPDSYLLSRRPAFACHRYRIDPRPYVPSPSEAAHWKQLGYEWTSLFIEGLQPPYYSFLVRSDRAPAVREGQKVR